MKSFGRVIIAAILMMCAGCKSERSPQFTPSASSKLLIPEAQDALTVELESSFGTPSKLVVWSMLPIDFGTFGGTLAASDVGHVVTLTSKSDLTFQSRVTAIRGAAVVIGDSRGDQTVYRVSAYDPVTSLLDIVDVEGKHTTLGAKPGDTLSVLGGTLQLGRDLYLRHCMHCHGVAGDGDGPTGKYFSVKPRDYRRGLFKFTSTKSSVKASREDLFRIVKLGVPGTYMPSFMLLPDEEVHSLVEYVRWLSMRGEMERQLSNELSGDFAMSVASERSASEVSREFNTFRNSDLPEIVEGVATLIKEDWVAPEIEDNWVKPASSRPAVDAASVERGRKLFMGSVANCLSCHGETGRGNGPSAEAFNDIPGGKPGEKSEIAGLFDIWGSIVKPRDLTSGIYRGGRRPIDIYRRISAGIKGTPMPGSSKLKEEEIWDITNYVLSIPFQKSTKKVGH